ncbi:MAG: hypothetical protein NT118_15665 [Lentisphaerae bacterium]|nr:hypothetical protein [Lentisphaerota bacterium]
MKADTIKPRCPGQDTRLWKPEDIFTLKCQFCGNEIEFFKDEPFLNCRNCGREVKNPRIDLGCAKWCKFADQCLGRTSGNDSASPIIEKVKALLVSQFQLGADAMKELEKACKMADDVLGGTKCDPCVVKTSLVVLFFFRDEKKYNDEISGILDKAGISHDQQEKIIAIVKAIISDTNSDSDEFKTVKKILK